MSMGMIVETSVRSMSQSMSTSMGINMNINMNMSMSVSICVAVRMSRIKRSRGRRSNSSNEGVDMKCMRKQKILACDNLGASRPYMIYLIQPPVLSKKR
jgi:membrane protease subunit (stomatin/prohibitin family)